jgi:hypothetical protein
MLSTINYRFGNKYYLFSQPITKNNQKLKKLIIVLTIVSIFVSCRGPLSTPESSGDKQKVHKVVVKEVIHAAGYTYLNVSEKRKSTWLAVPGMDVSKGDKLTYSGGMIMNDFHSRELNRTFPSVLFLEKVTNESKKSEEKEIKLEGKMGEVKKEKIIVTIKREEGCISVAKLYESKADFSEKIIKVRGIITKINSAIMGKNWIHIQDGTEYNGAFDFTITTDSHLQISDTVTFEGKVSVNKDFGYGYTYEVIMEDGKLIR